MKTLLSIIVKTQFLSIVLLFASITLNGQSKNEFNNSMIHFKDNTPTLENHTNNDLLNTNISKDISYWPWTIIYDDGTADEFVAWVYPGGFTTVRFTPIGYPGKVTGGQLYVGDGFFPEGGYWLGSDFTICLFDDDGPDNMPGTLLDSVVVPINNYEWVVFDSIFDYEIFEGDFYIAMMQTDTAPNCAPIGVDMTPPTFYRSYTRINDTADWMLSPYQDFMIRAFMDFTQGIEISPHQTSINIFPNPATNVITISSQKEISKIEIYSLNGGKLQSHENIADQKYEMDVSKLENGTYIVKVMLDNQIVSRKFNIKKQ